MSITERVKNAYSAFKSTATTTTNETRTMNQLIDFLNLGDTPNDSLSEATYFACLKVLGEGLGKMPIKLHSYTDKRGVRAERDHPLYAIVKERPNPYMTAATFWSAVEYNRNHWGNAYVLIKGAGKKTTLWILPSDQVQVWYDDRKIISDVSDIFYIYTAPNGKRVKFSSEEILHFKTSMTFDGVVGISVQDQLSSTIKGNEKAQELMNKMYDSGFTAKAVLQYTGELSDDNVKKFVKGIEGYTKSELANEGIENIIPIPLGATLTPLNIKLADNQFLEIKQYSALQIASAFGIKPSQIGDYTKSSYASAEAQQLSFYVDTLLYIIKQYEEELSYKLLSDDERRKGKHFKFNVSVILRADLKTQIDTLSTAVNSFIYTPNEARNLLDLEDKDGGDRLLGNGASIPIELTGTQYTRNIAEPPATEPNGDGVGIAADISGEEVKQWITKMIRETIKETESKV